MDGEKARTIKNIFGGKVFSSIIRKMFSEKGKFKAEGKYLFC